MICGAVFCNPMLSARMARPLGSLRLYAKACWRRRVCHIGALAKAG